MPGCRAEVPDRPGSAEEVRPARATPRGDVANAGGDRREPSKPFPVLFVANFPGLPNVGIGRSESKDYCKYPGQDQLFSTGDSSLYPITSTSTEIAFVTNNSPPVSYCPIS